MSDLEVLAKYPNKKATPGLGEIFHEKLLVRNNSSDIKDPQVHPPAIFADIERVKNFEVFEDDVFLCGFPRSGTTLSQQMLWLIAHDFDFEAAEKVDVYNRTQDFSYFSVLYGLQGVAKDHIEKLERPRVLKTHYGVQFLPPQVWTKNPKIVFISRDVKDVAVSCFFIRNLYFREELDSMEEHYDDFLNDKMWFAPYREYLKNFEALRGKPNILFLTYEEVTADIKTAIRNVAKFLGKEASDENVDKLAALLDFKVMKKNPLTNMKKYWDEFNQAKGRPEDPDNFIRKGKVGGYSEHMSEEFAMRFNKWMAEEPKKE